MKAVRYMRACLFVCAIAACSGDAATGRKAQNNFYEFTVPWDQALELPVVVTKLSADAPAGKHGRLRAQGEKLVYEDGTPARFWGMALTLSRAFPPADPVEAKAVVRRLRNYGLNLVRLTGLDFPRNKLYATWTRSGELNRDTMARIDYFISELRRAGIYYSLSVNDSPMKAHGIVGVSANEHPVQHKKYKYIQLYDERAIKPNLEWHKAIYAHKNPYTELTYAQDPANVYVTAVGEDSIFNGYFRKDGAFLGEENWRLLEKKFNRFVLQKYGNTNRLRTAWEGDGKTGLSERERLEKGSVRLPRPGDLRGSTVQRGRDVMRFLFEVDRTYAERVREALREAGYDGLFAATNDWYGYANLRVNELAGDVVDMHGYFDHPLTRPGKHRGTTTEMVRNLSYIANPAADSSSMAREFSSNLYNFFASAMENRPLIITEWNHAAWSDYAYEGPLLLASYAALQGYPALVIHTYLSHDLHFKTPYSARALAAGGNPVLMSLSPTLGLAFIKGYVKQSRNLVPITIAADEDALWDATLRDRLDKNRRRTGTSYETGFVHKIRVRLMGKGAETGKQDAITAGLWKSDTGEIVWNFRDQEKALFTVSAPKFQLAAGRLDKAEAKLSALGVSLHEQGAVTAIALDDKPLEESSSILVTAVSSFRNTGAIRETVSKFGAWRNLIRVVDPGKDPVLMKRVLGRVTLRTAQREGAVVRGIMPDGSLVAVLSEEGDSDADAKQIAFSLGSVDTPWYWVRFK